VSDRTSHVRASSSVLSVLPSFFPFVFEKDILSISAARALNCNLAATSLSKHPDRPLSATDVIKSASSDDLLGCKMGFFFCNVMSRYFKAIEFQRRGGNRWQFSGTRSTSELTPSVGRFSIRHLINLCPVSASLP
jgi:hypothetical protein